MREARQRGRDARVEVQVLPPAERYFGSVGTGPEPGSGGDPEDDGRGFFSAGWGNGHEGVGIEILEVTFVKVRHKPVYLISFVFELRLLTVWCRSCVQGGTAHRAPGLGRQNRKQRLGEYATERGAVLGFAASAATSGAVGGRTKRARGVGVGGPGGPDSDETDEDGMGTDSDEIEDDEEEDMDVDALAARVTIVFEGGRSGALPGYVLIRRSYSVRTVLTTYVVNVASNTSLMRFGQLSCTRDACCLPLIPQLHECASGNVLMTRAAMTRWR